MDPTREFTHVHERIATARRLVAEVSSDSKLRNGPLISQLLSATGQLALELERAADYSERWVGERPWRDPLTNARNRFETERFYLFDPSETVNLAPEELERRFSVWTGDKFRKGANDSIPAAREENQ